MTLALMRKDSVIVNVRNGFCFIEINLGHHVANIFKSLKAKKTALFAISAPLNSSLLYQVMELSLM